MNATDEYKRTQSSDAIRFQFQCQPPDRIEQYKDPSQTRNDACTICWGSYLREEQLRIFSCKHSLHERCFSPDMRFCYYDKSHIGQEITKVDLLGRSILFRRDSSRDFGKNLFNESEVLNHSLNVFIRKLENKDRTFLTNEICRANLEKIIDAFIPIFQDLIDTYDKIILEDQISEQVNKRARALLEACQSTQKDPVCREVIDCFFQWAYDLNEGFIFKYSACWDLRFARLSPVSEYYNLFIQNRDFLEVKEASNFRFQASNFKALRAFTSDAQKRDYLANLSRPNLRRLRTLAEGKGPTSLFIQKTFKDLTWLDTLHEPFVINQSHLCIELALMMAAAAIVGVISYSTQEK